MGRKSRKRRMLKPFCYFCNREFDDEKVLIMHQKAKHFKCGECNRKLETANGLSVHMQQVHKVVQRKVPFALEGRDNISSIVQGMQGVPFDAIEEHQLKHQKKMGDIDTCKQQRISWAVVMTAPTPEQFLAQLSMGNVYFPGFTAPHETYIPPKPYLLGQNPYATPIPPAPPYGHDGQPRRHGGPGGTHHAGGADDRRGRRLSTGVGAGSYQPHDEIARQKGFAPSGTGPLILGPTGMPIEAPSSGGFSDARGGSRPMVARSLSIGTGAMGFTPAPKGFSDGPAAAAVHTAARAEPSDAHGFRKVGGFSDAPAGPTNPAGFSEAQGPSRPQQELHKQSPGFSDAPQPPASAVAAESSSPTLPEVSPRPPQVDDHDTYMALESSEVEVAAPADNAMAVDTQIYRASGVAPLFIPPPTLVNTKLLHEADMESIEEMRAARLYGWQEAA
ncbi:zinc finger protein 207, putative [Babesia bigemina]|uniref:Zinc finger protein 207, putative n=1 Tax=Babesia bigemina TaxID=5866 RepID=A0A061D460_BABBI|nr:zinc finger protein 207, putative [Babesia bigemina]CDR94827.1 zinc finger protein 207, putative [Babesia bigemina]|eukprot:XP_012767013.1 zinc finger protein 207, putative [Babesia bigemina]